MRRSLVAAVLVVLPALARADEPAWLESLPQRARPDVVEPVVDAIQVWRLGAAYIPESETLPIEEDESDYVRPFTEVDERLRRRLERGARELRLRGSMPPPLTSALDAEDRGAALIALAVLIRERDPLSVRRQWEALARLRDTYGNDRRATWLLDQLGLVFEDEAVMATLLSPATPSVPREPVALQWAVRAAGVLRIEAAVPRLTELLSHADRDVARRAVTSLGEIPGDAAVDALDACMRSWDGTVFRGAARALRERAPERLRTALHEVEAPGRYRFEQGMLLAQLDDPAAVPHLVVTAGGTAKVDDRYFDTIERLATREHLPLLEKLPGWVGPHRRRQAERMLARARERVDAER